MKFELFELKGISRITWTLPPPPPHPIPLCPGLCTRTVIDMTSIERSKYFFQLIEKNIMSIVMSIN